MATKRKHDDDAVDSDLASKTKRAKTVCAQPERQPSKKSLFAWKHTVRGICLACKEPVTTRQRRFKMCGAYCHTSCYLKVPTPFACRVCGGSTVLGDMLIFYNKPNQKYTRLTPVGCDHMECIQRSVLDNKARKIAVAVKTAGLAQN